MLKMMLSVTAALVLTATANAQNKNNDIQLKSRTVDFQTLELDENSRPMSSVAGELTGGLRDLMNPLKEAEIVMDTIVNMGAKFWNLIEKGRAVVNYQQYVATALPQGVQDWTQMQGWKASYLTQDVYFQDKMSLTGKRNAVVFSYRLVFTCNGNINGRGKYIGYATIEPAKVNVAWGGYKFDVQVAAPAVFNMGTSENPVAGMKLEVKYVAKNVVSEVTMTDSYIVMGNCTAKAM